MGTSAQIKIEGDGVPLIYTHCDGYPSAVIPFLLPFVDRFMKGRGFDPEYMAARCCHDLIRFFEDGDSFTGYGLDDSVHGDIEYLYRIDKTGAVTVEAPVFDGDNKISDCPVLARYPLGTTVPDEIVLKNL